MFLALLTLFTGLAISAVAIYYSVLGLAAIFAAAPIPIYIMGTILEVSKLVTASWLKQNWSKAPFALKTYLTIAVAVLMLITSMGIFGFLSKAHSDAGLVSGDVQAKIAVYDQKIQTAKENIETNRKALKQMDEAVDQVMARSTSEQGANNAVNIRRSQAKERARLLKEIETEQRAITKLNEERAPIAAEIRKVEAEVGPIKYIAAFIYGETDPTILEKAVTWVIIVIVLVFDPLAVLLLLASQMSFQWIRDQKNGVVPVEPEPVTEPEPEPEPVKEPEPLPEEPKVHEPVQFNDAGEHPKDTFEHELEPVVEEPKLEDPIDTEPIVIEHIEIPEEPKDNSPDFERPGDYLIPPEVIVDPVAQEIVEDGNPEDTIDLIEAKRAWKEKHPEDSLKNQRRLLELGLIDQLPWEKEPYLKKKNLTYLEKVGKEQVKKEISED